MSFRLVKDILSRKLGVAPPTRPRGPLGLALGRPVSLEEIPFILAGDSVAVRHPGDPLTVLGHGQIEHHGTRIHRFHLSAPGGGYGGMLQVVEGSECRFFQPYDEVLPATTEEWAFWLDDEDGYIGYPIFDAKGTMFRRVWNPGPARVPPVRFAEGVDEADGKRASANHTAMLYSRQVHTSSGPLWEYLLLSAVEAGDGTAWIDIMRGIDLDPGMVKA